MPAAEKRGRIAQNIRQKITDGEYEVGSRLPTIKTLSATYEVATETVRQALAWLQAEGLIRTTPRGTWVLDGSPVGLSAYDRLGRVRRAGLSTASGETVRVTDAELVVPPLYVGEIFDLDPGERVCRRQYVTGRGQQRLSLAVDWYPATLAEAVPELLSTMASRQICIMQTIKAATGREPATGRDAMHSREATEREAQYLGIKRGSAILALVHEWSDDQGLIVYGEECIPQGITIGYEYPM